jgi:xanthine dehydrogenase YagT iron-sulfur-binding subunit
MLGSSLLNFRASCPKICGHGGVLVLVVAQRWGSPSSATLFAIEAELRALGASLLVVDEDSLFYFRPDERIGHDDPLGLTPLQLRALLQADGATAQTCASPGLNLSVLDDEGALRFRIHRPIAAEDAHAALLEALRLAGRSVVATGGRALFSRREVVVYSLVGAATLVFGNACKQASERPPAPVSTPAQAHEVAIVLSVNGQEHHLNVEPRVSLLDALRERLHLTGSKKGCDHGQCGACTVLVDGRRVNACLTLAIRTQHKSITTIEGLAHGEALHPMQDAFVHEDALQCGYCTPGQIMSAVGLLAERRASSDADIREQMSGNICRCGAYTNIVRAIQRARKGEAT